MNRSKYILLKMIDKEISKKRMGEGMSKIIFGVTNQNLDRDKELSVHKVKDTARVLYNYIESLGLDINEGSISKRKLEECVMWAVKGISEK
jgi:hypothetical protein